MATVSDESLNTESPGALPSLSGRVSLGIREVAAALGVSEGLVRKWLPEMPHLHLGERVLVPVEPLREWLHSRARAEEMGSKRVAEDIVAALNGDSK